MQSSGTAATVTRPSSGLPDNSLVWGLLARLAQSREQHPFPIALSHGRNPTIIFRFRSFSGYNSLHSRWLQGGEERRNCLRQYRSVLVRVRYDWRESTNVGRGLHHPISNLCEETRQHAFDRMIEHAAEMGANAVIGVRYGATEVMQSVTEVLCYGTAVRVQPL